MVLQLREVFVTPEHMAIVTEYAAGGSLQNYMEAKGRGARLDEANARCMCCIFDLFSSIYLEK
jgi:serine/threonine protein kinase